MKSFDPYLALALPPEARVDRRVPKRLLAENGAFAAGDRRRIAEGIEQLRWLAALKPSTVGIAAYRRADREYLEIAVLRLDLGDGAGAGRLVEIVHRAVPYPVLLIVWRGGVPRISVAHKRQSLGESGRTVIDGEVVTARIAGDVGRNVVLAFRDSLALVRQPRDSLFALYQGWIDNVQAYRASRLTGAFSLPPSRAQAAVRESALRELGSLDARIARVRTAAGRERQVARRAKMNLELACLRRKSDAARARL